MDFIFFFIYFIFPESFHSLNDDDIKKNAKSKTLK